MKLIRVYIGISILCFVFFQCVPAEDTSANRVTTTVNYSITDSLVQQICEWQVVQDKASIFPFLKHPDATYRYAAVQAFSGMIASSDVDSLSLLLTDPSEKVRTMAAYVIGQSQENAAQKILIGAFRQYDSLSTNNEFNATILEGIGKCGDENYLNALTTISTYQKTDTTLLTGQLKGIFAYMDRALTSPKGTQLMVNIATGPSYPLEVRRVASNYLYRVKNPDIIVDGPKIAKELSKQQDPILDMGLAVAANKSKNDSILPVLLNQLENHPDYRVRCNLIRSINNFSPDKVWDGIVKALNDPNPHVSVLAAEYIINNGGAKGAETIRTLSRSSGYTQRVKSMLLAAANKYYGYNYKITRANISSELKNLVLQESNPLRKGQLVKLLVFDVYQANFVLNELGTATDPGYVTQLLESLSNILEDPKLNLVYPLNSKNQLTQNIIDVFLNKISQGDVSAIQLFLNLIENNKNDLAAKIVPDQLSKYLSIYDVPDKMDAYNSLAEFLNLPIKTNADREYVPIDWSQLSETSGTINTNKGEIDIELFPNAAPQTVSRFIELSKQGFYNEKYFHRVVPNFVIQTGCSIGNGYGTLSKYLRTEVPPLHFNQAGFLGMASSGKDTESAQFFITHSPTPHLDGKYTIFGRVTKGMNVVHSIEYGDQINSIAF